MLQAIKGAISVDRRASSQNPAHQLAAQLDAVKAGVRAGAAGTTGISQKATCGAKAVQAGQMYPWLTPSIIEELLKAYPKSIATSGKEFATLLRKDGELAQLLQRLEQREARQAAALQAALGLAEPLSLFFCDHELRRAGEGVLPGRLRGWCNSFYRWAY